MSSIRNEIEQIVQDARTEAQIAARFETLRARERITLWAHIAKLIVRMAHQSIRLFVYRNVFIDEKPIRLGVPIAILLLILLVRTHPYASQDFSKADSKTITANGKCIGNSEFSNSQNSDYTCDGFGNTSGSSASSVRANFSATLSISDSANPISDSDKTKIADATYSLDDGVSWRPLHEMLTSEFVGDNAQSLSYYLPPEAGQDLSKIAIRLTPTDLDDIGTSKLKVSPISLSFVVDTGPNPQVTQQTVGVSGDPQSTTLEVTTAHDSISKSDDVKKADGTVTVVIKDSSDKEVVPFSTKPRYVGAQDGKDKWDVEVTAPAQTKAGTYVAHFSIGTTDNNRVSLTQDFTWGVLALNPDKSVYKPGQSAELDMAVLDQNGEMTCDADVQLDISGPDASTLSTSSGTITVNPVCAKSGKQNDPDYEAHWKVPSATGTYTFRLTATTAAGTHTISQNIDVQANPDVVVSRKSGTRIYPVDTYDMDLEVTTQHDFDGTINEPVPDTFAISHQSQVIDADTNEVVGSATTPSNQLAGKTQFSSTKEITWNANLKAGHHYTLSYTYDAPDISPEFFLLGSLKLKTGGVVAYSEPRQWELANDVARTWKLYSTGSTTDSEADPSATTASSSASSQSNVTTENEKIKFGTTGGTYAFKPGIAGTGNNTPLTPLTDHYGWFTTNPYVGTSPGTNPWSFKVTTNGGSTTAASCYMRFIAWTNTTRSVTGMTKLFDSGSAYNATNVCTNTTQVNTFNTWNPVTTGGFTGPQNLTTISPTGTAKYIFMEYWLVVTPGSNVAANLTLNVDGDTGGVAFSTEAGQVYTAGANMTGTIYDTSSAAITTQPSMKSYYDGALCSSCGGKADASGNFVTGVDSPASNHVITTYISSGASLANGIGKYTPANTAVDGKNMAGLQLYQNQIDIEPSSAGSISNTDLDKWDKDNDSSFMLFTITGTTYTANSGTKLRVLGSGTYVPGGDITTEKLYVDGTYTGATETVTITGSGTNTTRPFNVNGTFTPTSNTVKFTSSSSIDVDSGLNAGGTITYNNLSFLPTSGTPNYKLLGGLGILACTINLTGTFTIGDGTIPVTADALTDNHITITASKIVVNAASTLSQGGGTVTVKGTGTGASRPFIVNGTYTANSGSFIYASPITTTIEAEAVTYNALVIQPTVAFVNPTYRIGTTTGQTLNAASLRIGLSGFGILATVDLSTYNPTVNITGGVDVQSSSTLQAGTSPISMGALSLKGTYTGSSETTTLTGSGTGASRPLTVTGVFTPNTDTFKFTGTAASDFQAGITYNNVEIAPSSGTPTWTLNAAGTTTVKNFTLTGGTFANTSATLAVTGNFAQNANTTFGGASLTVSFTGTGTQTISKTTGTFSSILNIGTSGTVQLNTTFGVTQACTVASGVFSLNGQTFICAGVFTVNSGATLQLQGSESPTTPTLNSGSAVTYIGNGAGPYVVKNWTYTGVILTINDAAHPSDVFQLNNDLAPGATSFTAGTINTTGATLLEPSGVLTLNGATWSPGTMAIDADAGFACNSGTMNAGSAPLVVTGTLSVAGCTMTATSSSTQAANFNQTSGTFTTSANNIVLSGNFSHTAGTFTASSGSVILNGTATAAITGATTFYNLSIGGLPKEVDFSSAGSDVINVTHTFNVVGGAGNLVKLYSSSSGNKWHFHPTGTATVSYADVKDGGCETGSITITPTNSTDSHNNDSCWSFGATNSAPNSPSALAQYKSDGTTSIAAGGWTNEATVKMKASVTDPDVSDNNFLCGEVDTIATGFSNTEDGCGSSVVQGNTATYTATSLADGQYHWQVRSKDGAPLYSSWVSCTTTGSCGANGDAPTAGIDFGVDTTPPSAGSVNDGTSGDVTFNDGSLSSMSANWSGFSDASSGIQSYYYAIGTTSGGTDVCSWTTNSGGSCTNLGSPTSTSVTVTGLTLHTGQIYYFTIRAYDNAGTAGPSCISFCANAVNASSNGQLVSPTLSFSVSPSSTTFANLNATNSYTNTQAITLTTSTNGYGGYVIRGRASGLLTRVNGSQTIPMYTGGFYSLPDSWQSGDIGFGYTSSDTSVQGANIFQSSTCPGGNALAAPGCYAAFTTSSPGDIVADHASGVTGSTITNEQFTVTARVTGTNVQQAGTYSTRLVFVVTPTF